MHLEHEPDVRSTKQSICHNDGASVVDMTARRCFSKGNCTAHQSPVCAHPHWEAEHCTPNHTCDGQGNVVASTFSSPQKQRTCSTIPAHFLVLKGSRSTMTVASWRMQQTFRIDAFLNTCIGGSHTHTLWSAFMVGQSRSNPRQQIPKSSYLSGSPPEGGCYNLHPRRLNPANMKCFGQVE